MITNKELSLRMTSMQKYFPLGLVDSSSQHRKIIRKMSSVMHSATRTQLLIYEPDEMIACMINILFYCERILHKKEHICEWKQRRRKRAARTCYDKLLRIYIPERTEDVLETIIDVFNERKLWDHRIFCYEVIRDLFKYGASGSLIVLKIWDRIDSSGLNIEEARAVLGVLCELLDSYDWPETRETVRVVEKFLQHFYDSIVDAVLLGELADRHEALRKGIELCVRNMIKHLPNNCLLFVVYQICSWTVQKEITDDIILNFGNTLEYAANMYHAEVYEKTLTPSLFPLLMRMIASQSRIISMLGNKVMQYLIDRENNRTAFDTPRIFFEGTDYDLRIGRYRPEDKLFFKTHRKILHDSLLKCIATHCSSRINLEATYRTICLIAIEVPCGFVAAAMVCLIMNIQDFILQQKDLRREVAYHVHATVIAFMSLLCWIHKAKVFYNYVNKIMMERAQWAPHLNPPLLSQYDYAIHHIRWDKPELFFVDWEARYGLWKCFRLRDSEDRLSLETQLRENQEKKNL